jgi:hypothetical protein
VCFESLTPLSSSPTVLAFPVRIDDGGWVAPLADVDPVFGEEIGKLFGQPFDLLLGRRTYDIFAAYWPYAETTSPRHSTGSQST